MGAASREEPREDLQGDFQALKESLQRVKLPPQLRLNESRQNLKREDQGAFNLVSKSAGYVETTLKVLQSIDDSRPVSSDDLESILLVQMTHMRYLQDEYRALIIRGTCNKEVSRLFRAFRKNTSGLSDGAIQDLRNTSQVVAAMQQAQPYQPRPRFPGSQPWRPRSRFSHFRPIDRMPFPSPPRSSQLDGLCTLRTLQPFVPTTSRHNHIDAMYCCSKPSPNPLARNLDLWKAISTPQHTLGWITDGVPIPFSDGLQPPAFSMPNQPMSANKRVFVSSEIKDLLISGTIEKCAYTPRCLSGLK